MQLLTPEQRAVLTAQNLATSAGCELLRPDLVAVEDVSDDLLGGAVEWNLYADVHRTARLQLTRALAWGVDLLRPYVTLTDADSGLSARFPVGVFALTTPELAVGQTPVSYDVQGFDRLHLLRREVGDSYEVAAGVQVLDAVRGVIADAGLSGVMLDGSVAGTTVPTPMVWPLTSDTAVTWLRVVNDLLALVNYRGVWADENGLLRSEPYVSPSERSPEWTFDADSAETLVAADRTVTFDLWEVPNRWVFVQSNLPGDPPPQPVDGTGRYVVDNVDGTVLGVSSTVSQATSQSSRALVWTRTLRYDAASQSALVALGNRRVLGDLRVAQLLDFSTAPMPAAGHADIFTVRDVAAGVNTRVQARRWQLDLDGRDMSWQWEAV